MISTEVKADVKQQIEELVPVSCNFLQEIPSKLDLQYYNVKLSCIFHLILLEIPYIMILPVKKTE